MALSPNTRSRRRTARQGIQSDQLQLQGDQQAAGQRTRQFHKEANSYRGATTLAIQAIQRTNLGGLRGTPEGRQLQQELRGRTRDLRGSLPFTIAATQRDYKGDMQGINQDIAGARLSLAQHQQDLQAAVNDSLAAHSANQAAKKGDVDRAFQEALRLVHEQTLVNKGEMQGTKHPTALPQNEGQWVDFENALRQVEGVNNRSARKAVKRLQDAIVRETQAAVTPSHHTYQSRPPLYGG